MAGAGRDTRRCRRLWRGVGALALALGTLVVGSPPPAGASAPTNDDFASPAVLSSTTSGSVTGSNLDATIQTGEPTPWADVAATVWWTWTAPSTGTYLFDTCGSNFTTGLGVYSGTSVGELTDVTTVERECYYQGSWRWNEAWELSVTEGESYRIQLGGGYGAMGDFVLRWWPEVTPPNDDFASATALASTSSGSTTGTNRFSTSETGEPSLMYNRGSVWWTWTPPSSGTYMFDTCGSNTDTNLGVYTGTAIDALTQIASGGDDCDYQSQATFSATVGTTYTIGVAGWGTWDTADITLRWQSDTPPVNDDFASAVALSSTVSGSAEGNNRFATSESGEPSSLDGSSVWWTWTAPATGTYLFDTCGSNNYNSLGVFTGSSVSTLTEELVVYAGHCFLGAQLLFEAVADTTYAIGVGDATGDIVLHWATGTAPGNDAFASAAELSGGGGTVATSTLFATEQAGEPGVGDHSIWWTWTAPASPTSVTFDTCGSSVPRANLGIYTGTAVNALTWVGTMTTRCDHQSVTFTPSPGGLYYIVVASAYGGMGDVVLHWPASGTATAPSMTTQPSNVTVNTGDSVQFTAAAVGVPAPTVQWQISTDGGTTWYDFSGATSGTLSFTAAYSNNGYQYQAVFTNASGSVTSNAATLTVNPSAANATVTGLTATTAKGKITVTFTPSSTGGAPAATDFQCSFSGKGAKAGGSWVSCTSGYISKGSASSASVRAGYSATGPWGSPVSVLVTRA